MIHVLILTTTAFVSASVLAAVASSVDSLLDGGLREGHLTELYGEPASGKTQVLQV